MVSVPAQQDDTSPRASADRRRARSRIELLSGITILFGILITGAAWAVLSDRSADNDLTVARVETAEAGQTPSLPVVSGATAVATSTAASVTATAGTTSADVPLFEPQRPIPTATLPGSTPAPTITPPPDMPPPTHIRIPAAGIDTGVVEVSAYPIEIDGATVLKWGVADWAGGHHDTSASPGEVGNIVIAGHDDYRGEVFRGLHDAHVGDDVFVESAAGTFHYVIREIHLRKEKGEPLSERLNTGLFIAPMPEERLTLITCWPYGIDDHRMIIVAKPADDDAARAAP